MSPQKKAKARVQPRAGAGERQAKVLVRKPDAGDHRPTFSFQYADRADNGAWSWPSAEEAQELLHFLCEMSQLTWGEILAQQTGGGQNRHKKHHAQSLDSICPAAQKRFSELRLDETFEDLFRFRLSGEKRLWGSRVGGVFYVLWWDPNHRVCPSNLRHT